MTKKRIAKQNVPPEEMEETQQANWLALLREWQQEKLLAKLHAGTLDEDFGAGRLLIWIDKMLKKWAVQHLWGTRVEQRLKETEQQLAETEQRLVALEQWRHSQEARGAGRGAGNKPPGAESGWRGAGSGQRGVSNG